MMTSPQVSQRRQREAVLIVGHGDGFIESFAENHVDVHFAVCPYMESPEGEALAQEFVELLLPWRYRQLYWPGKLRAMGIVRKLRPSEIAKREWELELLRTLDAIANQGRKRRKIWIS